jgi:hypothetical protein
VILARRLPQGCQRRACHACLQLRVAASRDIHEAIET